MKIRLWLINLFRWIKHYFFVWTLLGVIYSITATLIFQSLLENITHENFSFISLWWSVLFIISIPAFLENLPLRPISFQWGKLQFMPDGIFAEKFWNHPTRVFTQLYLRHELRRGQTWFVVILVVLLDCFFVGSKHFVWVFLSLLPIQRALYSIGRLKNLALSFHPHSGAKQLLVGLWISQVIQLSIGWIAFGIVSFMPLHEWGLYFLACLGGGLGSAFVAFEGDTARPWLVNFIALASGLLGGYLTLAWPWFFPILLYFFYRQLQLVEKRFYSVEYIDEDFVIS